MEIKKSPKADLEKKRTLHFVMGLVCALALVYVALQWQSHTRQTQEPPLPPVSELPAEPGLAPVMPLPPSVPNLPENRMEAEPAAVDPQQIKVVDNAEDVAKATSPSAPLQWKDMMAEDVNEEEAAADAPPLDKSITAPIQPDSLPCFPGGDAACMRFLTSKVHYPAGAYNRHIQGCVQVQFIVEKDGKLSDIRIARSVSPELDREALRVVRLMPPWRPGRQDGVPKRFLYVLPVDFRLR